jgi:hypothetical protein
VDVEFIVADTGIGISPEKMDLLFKRFSQVDGSNTRRYSGTGLGLAICKELAEMMGGYIKAESEPSEGSTFRLMVSLSPVKEPAGLFAGDREEKLLSPIVMDRRDLSRLLAEKTGGRDKIVIVDSQPNLERCSRVRLGKGGEILFDAAGKAVDGVDVAAGERELRQVLKKIRALLREGRLSQIEEEAHKVKKAALLIGRHNLMELAFKAELAARKGKWDQVQKYCLKMMDEFPLRPQNQGGKI